MEKSERRKQEKNIITELELISFIILLLILILVIFDIIIIIIIIIIYIEPTKHFSSYFALTFSLMLNQTKLGSLFQVFLYFAKSRKSRYVPSFVPFVLVQMFHFQHPPDLY